MEWHQKEIDNAINDLDSSETKKTPDFNELMFTLVLSSLVFFAVELEKMWRRRKVESEK